MTEIKLTPDEITIPLSTVWLFSQPILISSILIALCFGIVPYFFNYGRTTEFSRRTLLRENVICLIKALLYFIFGIMPAIMYLANHNVSADQWRVPFSLLFIVPISLLECISNMAQVFSNWRKLGLESKERQKNSILK